VKEIQTRLRKLNLKSGASLRHLPWQQGNQTSREGRALLAARRRPWSVGALCDPRCLPSLHFSLDPKAIHYYIALFCCQATDSAPYW
jgi:hypothetical protein